MSATIPDEELPPDHLWEMEPLLHRFESYWRILGHLAATPHVLECEVLVRMEADFADCHEKLSEKWEAAVAQRRAERRAAFRPRPTPKTVPNKLPPDDGETP